MGLKRLWLLITVVFCLLGLFHAMNVNDLRGEGLGSSQCIPSTISVETRSVLIGRREPSPDEIKASIRKNPDNWSEQPDGTFIALFDPYAVHEERSFFYCKSYLSLIRNVLVAALISLALGAFVGALGWVLKGFRKPS